MKTNSSGARYLALFVAVAFLAVASSFTGLILSPRQGGGVSWQQVSLIGGYVVGAAFLFAGAALWYGRKPWLLRLAGFILLLISSSVNIFWAPLLIPLLLLAAFSLCKHKQGEPRRLLRLMPGDILIVIGTIWLSLSVFLPWYSWVFQDSPASSHSNLKSLWGASPFIATVIMAATVVVVGIMALRLSGVFDSGNKRHWEYLMVFTAVALMTGLTVFRMVIMPLGEGADKVIFSGGGYLFGLVGLFILMFGAIVKLLRIMSKSE